LTVVLVVSGYCSFPQHDTTKRIRVECAPLGD
jgi:hypothetical protein